MNTEDAGKALLARINELAADADSHELIRLAQVVAILALILGGMLGMVLALGREALARTVREESAESKEFARLKAELLRRAPSSS